MFHEENYFIMSSDDYFYLIHRALKENGQKADIVVGEIQPTECGAYEVLVVNSYDKTIRHLETYTNKKIAVLALWEERKNMNWGHWQ